MTTSDLTTLAFLAGALFGVALTYGMPEEAPTYLALFGVLFMVTGTGTLARYVIAYRREQARPKGDADSIVALLEELRGPKP